MVNKNNPVFVTTLTQAGVKSVLYLNTAVGKSPLPAVRRRKKMTASDCGTLCTLKISTVNHSLLFCSL